MILLAFRHGLRAAEIVDLRWDQVDLGRNACLHVRRVKNGMPSVHPLQGDEMRALKRSVERHSPARASRRWWPDWARKLNSSSVFTRTCCAMRAATHWRTKGHDTRALQAYLGHKNIQHTVRYTELSPARFKDFWLG